MLYADLDYDEMQQAMDSLRERRGATVLRFAIPEPATTANILAAYESQLSGAPVAEAAARDAPVEPDRDRHAGQGDRRDGRARGVDTIVDAAQTIGHLDFTLADLDADFVGFSLHKWLCAPIGTGAIWIRGSPPAGHRAVHGQHDVPGRRHPQPHAAPAPSTSPRR